MMELSVLPDPYRVVSEVRDPELPFLSLVELGVLREVVRDGLRVRVTLTPTYLGCPALGVMRLELSRALRDAGFVPEVTTSFSPPWSSDDVTPEGRRKLLAAGISPPGVSGRLPGPVPLTLGPPRRLVSCPRCGQRGAVLLSEFGATACRALYRCEGCLEPFEVFKEH